MSKPGLGWDDWYTPDASLDIPVASAGGGGSAATAYIPDWTQLNTTKSLIELFRGDAISNVDPTFRFCIGIHSDSNIETAHDKVSEIIDVEPDKTLGAIFAGVTETDKYNETLMANQWLKVWLTEKFISTYGGAIIVDVYKKFKHLLGENKDIESLYEHLLQTDEMSYSLDVHGELNIQPNGTNVYSNVIKILGGTLPKSSLLFNKSIFDKTVRSTKSYEEIVEEQRQITIIDLQKFIIKRDECRETIGEISNKISEYHYKILELQKSLDATASQEMSQVIESASQIIASASQVIENANSIAENINENPLPPQNLLPPQITLTPDFSPGQELADLRTKMNNLYYDLGEKITKLDELVQDVKDTYISLRSILYYELSNPQEALGKLDQTLFSGTNEENGGLGIVLRLGENALVAKCVQHYLQNTFDRNLTFVGDGLTFTHNGSTVDAYNPSEAMKLNIPNVFRNFTCGKYPSFAWLFLVYCILKKNGNLPFDAIKVLTMTLFDDCTHSTSDNIISVILRTQYRKGNTTDIKSELLYKFIETVGIKYSLNLLHCMGKPSSESIEDFKEKVKYFVGTYIAEDKQRPFDRRIAEIGATQTLGSQESMRSQIDYFNTLNDAVVSLSQKTNKVLLKIDREVQTFSQPGFLTLSASDLRTEGDQSATGGGGSSQENYSPNFWGSQGSDDSNPFPIASSKTGGGSANNMIISDTPVKSIDDINSGGGSQPNYTLPVGTEEERNNNEDSILYGMMDKNTKVKNANVNNYDENYVLPASHKNFDAKRLKPCYAFQKGECNRGSSCIFSHDPNANANKKGVGVCYPYQQKKLLYPFEKNGCSRGEDCNLSHIGGSIRTTKNKRKGGRKTRRPKKNKRTRRTKDRAKYTRKR